MNKKRALLTIAVIGAITTHAQQISNLETIQKIKEQSTNIDTVAWIYNGNLSLGINQGILHNWAAGGELASLTVNGLFNGVLTRYNGRSVWVSNLDMAYGLLYTYSNAFVPRKTDDRIDLTSKYGYQLKKDGNLYVTGLLNAKTQFTKAYNYDAPRWDTFSTSKFLSPLYLTFAPGIEYRKGSMLSVFFSPAALRTTFVDRYYTLQTPEGAFGVKHGETFRLELGAYFSTRFQKDFGPNVSYRGRFDAYSNYLAKNQTDPVTGALIKSDNPGNIDILWDNVFTFKFYKYFAINVGITAIYDNDVPYVKNFVDETGTIKSKNEPYQGLGWWQIKQVMSLGFNYKF
jgi:hypothetical protein